MRELTFVVSVFLAGFALSGCKDIQLASRTPTPIASTHIPTTVPIPTSILTELEAIDVEMRTQFGNVHPDCSSCIPVPDGANCSQYLWTKPIIRTEWIELFPSAHFYLLGFHQVENRETNSYGYRRDYGVIAQQDSQRYTAQSFGHLLEANSITTISDEKRELVAKAFALMTIPDYLEGEIVFTKWEEGIWPSSIRLNYNYTLTAWTKIQGLKIQWRFIFYEGLLIGADGYVQEQSIGDYIDVPFEELPGPSRDSLTYWRR
jgi:hypothetical protein